MQQFLAKEQNKAKKQGVGTENIRKEWQAGCLLKPYGKTSEWRKGERREDTKQLMSRPVKSSEVGVSPQQWQPRECCQNAMYTS